MDNQEKKRLLQVTNLKQYFPVGKDAFVKANDGISLDIYEGETFGLVGESGCGKSTLGRSILQMYRQTDGRTMYFGRTLDEIAPRYAYETYRSLSRRRGELEEKQARYAAFRKSYGEKGEQEQYALHGELTRLAKEGRWKRPACANMPFPGNCAKLGREGPKHSWMRTAQPTL